MPRIADNFFKIAIVFFIIGILMGLQMSISGEHNVIGAHAHTNLLGWVTMALFGGYYALNPRKAESRLATIHFWSFVPAVCVMVPSLYLLYLGYEAFEPPLAVASIVALASVAVFAVVVFTRPDAEVQATSPAAPAE
jgi:drug/metabolite transporter (DMT)-like permease